MSLPQREEPVIATTTIFTVLAFIVVLLRCHSRFIILKRWGAEDLLILCALPMSITFTSLLVAGWTHGLGKHDYELPASINAELLLLYSICITLYYTGNTFVKTSILAQMLRFFMERRQRIAIWSFIIIIVTFGFASICATMFACAPISYLWDRQQEGVCSHYQISWYTMSSFNICSDIAITLLPIPMLKSLQLPKTQKYGLMIVFALGGFTCIVAILRIPSLVQLAQTGDFSYDHRGAAIWSSIEMNTGIICACLPSLRPLINRFFPNLLVTSRQAQYPKHLKKVALDQEDDVTSWQRAMSIQQQSSVFKATSTVASADLDSFDKMNRAYGTKYEWSVSTDNGKRTMKGSNH